MPETDDAVLAEVRDQTCWITINRPGRRNSFDAEMLAQIIAVLERCAKDREIRAIVLTGAGDKAFSAGGYLTDLAESNETAIRALYRNTLAAIMAMRRVPQPVIGAINGYALGGGNELLMGCDLAIASEHAVLGQAEARVGSAAVLGGANLLMLSLGEKRAKEVALMCRQYSAEEALRLGWVNEVVPHEQLYAQVRGWCDELLALSPQSVELTKTASNYCADLLRPSLDEGLEKLLALVGSEDMKEGARAFVEKRSPVFAHRRVEAS